MIISETSIYFILFKPTVDCEWGNWQIGECSQTCGGGSRINNRKIIIASAHGGKECSGPTTVTEQCNTKECPGKY